MARCKSKISYFGSERVKIVDSLNGVHESEDQVNNPPEDIRCTQLFILLPHSLVGVAEPRLAEVVVVDPVRLVVHEQPGLDVEARPRPLVQPQRLGVRGHGGLRPAPRPLLSQPLQSEAMRPRQGRVLVTCLCNTPPG